MSFRSRLAGLFRRPTAEQRNDRLIAGLQGKTGQARKDAWQNILTRIGTQGDKRTAGEFICNPVTNLEARELWRGDDIAKRVIELRPRDALRRGYDIKLDKQDKADDIMAILQHIKANRQFVRCGQQEIAYGGSALFPVINDVQGNALAEPLEDDAITLPKAFHVFEPRQLQPVEWDDDPNSETFNSVSLWRLVPLGVRTTNLFTGLEIHASRLIIFPGIRVSMEQPTGAQQGWGDSGLTPMRDVLRDYNLSWAAAVILLQEMGQGVFQMDQLAQMVANDKDEEIQRRIMILDIMKSVLNTMVISKDDVYTRQQVPMSGMPEVLQQMCTRLAAAADMPVTKLMGQSPAGLNATGESDITIYDDSVDAWRDEHMPQLERMVRIIILAKDGPLAGKEPETWSVEHRPLRQPTAEQTAALRKTIAETDAINIANEVYSGDDAAESHYGGDTFNPDIKIDWKAREAQKKAMEQASADALEMQQQIMAKAAANGQGPGTGSPSNPDGVSPEGAPAVKDGGKPANGARTDDSYPA
jgi:phage-related protein (TIGR01555 family)